MPSIETHKVPKKIMSAKTLPDWTERNRRVLSERRLLDSKILLTVSRLIKLLSCKNMLLFTKKG